MAETSTKPYMIRALYEWCCDNGYTPYLAVAVDEHTIVPRQHVKSGEIVLNVSPMATSRLSLGNEVVEFQARFSGVAQQISIPVGNVSAIYARETGQGMAFEVTRAPAAREGDGEEAPGEGAGEAAGSSASAGGSSDNSGNGHHHAPGSTVQSLRGGARRRGPRSIDLDGASETAASAHRRTPAGTAVVDGSPGGTDGPKAAVPVGEAAANSRKRAGKGQGSADVLAFAPSGESVKKKGGNPASRSKSSEAGHAPPPEAGIGDDDDPPPVDGGGKGGKARLTRVK